MLGMKPALFGKRPGSRAGNVGRLWCRSGWRDHPELGAEGWAADFDSAVVVFHGGFCDIQADAQAASSAMSAALSGE
jgi:hypothetical protein